METHSSGKFAPLAFSALIGLAGPAFADIVVDFPAGLACPDFAIRVVGTGDAKGFSGDGGVGRGLVSAGTGISWTFTNLTTNTRWSPSAVGAAMKVQPRPDGTATYTVTGGNAIVLYPSDVPAGPSTTWHAGRVVFTVDALGNYTVTDSRGAKTDVCAELSG
jgi:hypothetical protein